MTAEFLQFSKAQGNDLITPRPELDCPGLGRWIEAVEAGLTLPVILEATNEAVLDSVLFSTLSEHEYDPSTETKDST